MTKINHLKKWAKDLFPLNRTLAGKFNRLTLKYIKQNINKLEFLNSEDLVDCILFFKETTLQYKPQSQAQGR